MSYTLSLPCSCTARVSPTHGPAAVRRAIDKRGEACANESHQRGERVFLWELLPERTLDSGLDRRLTQSRTLGMSM
jgi:hypothetical protein